MAQSLSSRLKACLLVVGSQDRAGADLLFTPPKALHGVLETEATPLLDQVRRRQPAGAVLGAPVRGTKKAPPAFLVCHRRAPSA